MNVHERITAARAQQKALEVQIDAATADRRCALVNGAPDSIVAELNRKLAELKQLRQDETDRVYFLLAEPPAPSTYPSDQGSAMVRLAELQTKKAVLEAKRDRELPVPHLSAAEQTELDSLISHIGAMKQFLRRYVPSEEIA